MTLRKKKDYLWPAFKNLNSSLITKMMYCQRLPLCHLSNLNIIN